MAIEPGSYIRVPAGTLVWKNLWYENATVSTKDRTYVVKEVVDLAVDTSRQCMIMTAAEQHELHKKDAQATSSANYHKVSSRLRADALSLMKQRHGEDLCAVFWHGGFALLKDVSEADAPAKAKAPKAPTVLQQFVPGSEWTFTEDFQLLYEEPNQPAYGDAHRQVWNQVMAANPKSYYDDISAAMAKLDIKRTRPVDAGLVHRGDTLRVLKKTHMCDHEGVRLATVSVNDRKLVLPFDLISKRIAPKDIPTIKEFFLQDRETGEFFAKFEGDRPQMVRDVKFARKYKDLGILKLAVMDWTGYFDGLDDSEKLPVWVSEGFRMPLPQSWQAVAVEKFGSRAVLETVDIQPWYRNQWRLRELSTKYGPSVRKVYGTLERKGLLASHTHILIVRGTDDRHNIQNNLAELESAFAGVGIQRKSYHHAATTHSAVYSFATRANCMAARLACPTGLQATVLNVTSLTEEIENS